MQKNRRRSVYIQKDPQKQRSYSMIEESGLGEKNSNFIKEPIKKGEILENYNLIIKNKAYEGLSQIERWRARDFGCLFDMLKTFQKTLQLRQQQHQQLTKTYKQLRSENQRQQAELEEIMERNKFMQVQNSKIISNLIEVRQEYVKGNRGFQTKVKPSSSIECSNLFGKHYENIQLTQSELKNIKHLQSFQNQRSRSRFISLQGPLESKIYNQPQEDPEILTIPNILESFKPESDGVNELQPQLLSRARGASLYDPKKPSFNKASSFDQSEIKLETQIMKLNNVLMSKISSNPETKSSHLFLQEKKAPQVKKDNHFNRWQHK